MLDEARELHRQVTRWHTDEGSAVDVALAADACLDVGLDGPALVQLASMAGDFGPVTLAAALREAGVTHHRPADIGTSGPVPPAASELYRRATSWRTRQGSASDVVLAACDCLAAGLDGPGLVELASLTRSEAEDAVDGVLPAALRDVGLPDRSPLELVADRCLRLLAGEIGAKDLTAWAHDRFDHDSAPPLVEEFLELDDMHAAAGESPHWRACVTAEADLFLLLTGEIPAA